MMKRTIFLFLLILMPALLLAQDKKLAVVKPPKLDDSWRAVTYPEYDKNDKMAARVEISYVDPESLEIAGDCIVRKYIEPGKIILYIAEEANQQIVIVAPGCNPMHYSFREPVVSGLTYAMELRIEAMNHWRGLIMPSFGYSFKPIQSSMGLMLGASKDWAGIYVRAKIDPQFNTFKKGVPELSCDAQGRINGTEGWFNGKSWTSRFAITGGYMPEVFTSKSGKFSCYIYAGGGYGRRILAWEMYSGENDLTESVMVAPLSYTGFETEVGTILRFGIFSISAGVQTNSFKFVEANVGIGVMFP